MRALLVVLALLAGVRAAAAHEVALRPSRCPLDALTLMTYDGTELGAAVLSADAAPRLVWDAARSGVQLQSAALPPLPMVMAGTAGTVTVPVATNGTVRSDGLLAFPAATFTFEADGVRTTPTVALSTGLVGGDDEVVAGLPLTVEGTIVLQAILPPAALPPPWPASATILTLTCTASPIPDLDQLGPPPAITGLVRHGTRLKGLLTGAPEEASLRDGPVLLQVAVDAGDLGPQVRQGVLGTLADDGRGGLAVHGSQGVELRLRPSRRGWRMRLALSDPMPVEGDALTLRMRLGTVDASGSTR